MQICLINLFRPFLEKKSPGKRKFFIRKNCGSLAHIAFSKRKSFAKQKFFWQPAFSWTMQNQKGCVASQSFALQGRKTLGKEQFANPNWLLCTAPKKENALRLY
jgi:hypothetical protein